MFHNAIGLLIFGDKPASGAKLYNNTVRNNEIGIEIQSGARNTDVKNNTVYGNGTDVLNLGAATILAGNRPH